METILEKNWWSLIVRGVCALSLAFVAFIKGEISLLALVVLFGGYAMLDGIIALAGAVRAAESHERWAPLLIEGCAGIVAGVVAFSWPGATILDEAHVITAWAVLTGGLELAAAMRLRRRVKGESLLLLSGLASLILGALMIVMPLAGPLDVARVLASYAVVFGALLIGLGWRLRPRVDPRLASGLTR